MKNQKGITLIALVITIIILLIIASVATYTGINAIIYVRSRNVKTSSIRKLYKISNN